MFEHDEVAFGVALYVGVSAGDGRNSCSPEGVKMSGNFNEGVGLAGSAWGIFDECEGFHEVGDGDESI